MQYACLQILKMALTARRCIQAKLSFLINSNYIRTISTTAFNRSDRVPDSAIPVPVNVDPFGAISQPTCGAIYDKKPFKLKLEKGKFYHWCLCGKSKSQPLCDGTHKYIVLKIKERPVKFQVAETKEYWLCNCKQTTHRPFCDGTHLSEEIQAAVK